MCIRAPVAKFGATFRKIQILERVPGRAVIVRHRCEAGQGWFDTGVGRAQGVSDAGFGKAKAVQHRCQVGLKTILHWCR